MDGFEAVYVAQSDRAEVREIEVAGGGHTEAGHRIRQPADLNRPDIADGDAARVRLGLDGAGLRLDGIAGRPDAGSRAHHDGRGLYVDCSVGAPLGDAAVGDKRDAAARRDVVDHDGVRALSRIREIAHLQTSGPERVRDVEGDVHAGNGRLDDQLVRRVRDHCDDRAVAVLDNGGRIAGRAIVLDGVAAGLTQDQCRWHDVILGALTAETIFRRDGSEFQFENS
ncbi:MAG: hypothetical protein FP819_25535 [Rhizobiaceae bacterium]|nr:hypothetical protein [Rhizobiaceae bacterium]